MNKEEMILLIKEAYKGILKTNDLKEKDKIQRKIHELELRAKYYNLEIPFLDSIEKEAVIECTKEIFKEMFDSKQSGIIDNEALKKRQLILSNARNTAKRLNVSLDSIYQSTKKKELSNMFEKELDIHKMNFDDPITEEYCEACIKDYITRVDRRGIKQAIESRFITLPTSKKRGKDEFNFDTICQSTSDYIMFEGLKIVIKKIKENDTSKINDFYLSKLKNIDIKELEEFVNTRKTNNPSIIDLILPLKDGYNLGLEHAGGYKCGSYLFKASKGEEKENMYRIYLNLPTTNDAVSFVKEYCLECQRQQIPFDIKAFFNKREENQDGTILYSTYNDINKKISIVKNLLSKYETLEIGTPPPACTKIDEEGIIGLCNIGNCNLAYQNNQTYNDYINGIFTIALCKTINSYGYNLTKSDMLHQQGIETAKKIYESDKRKEFIKKLHENIHKEHNINNNYKEEETKNIAMDTWYIDEMRKKYEFLNIKDAGYLI